MGLAVGRPANAAVIYREDFTGQEGKGAVGPAPTIDTAGVGWSVDVSSASLTATDDWLRVEERDDNAMLEGRDLDGQARWSSPSVDIAGYRDVEIELWAGGEGDFETSDLYRATCRVDNGTFETFFDYDGFTGTGPGEENDAPHLFVRSGPLPAGDLLTFSVLMENNAASEMLRLDDIQVTGTAVPEPATFLLMGLGVFSLCGLRRRKH
jgi:hypothetical protein